MKKIILLIYLLTGIVVSVFCLDIVDDIIGFIGRELPPDFTHINHSGYDYYVKTIEDAYDHQKSLFFWLNDEGTIKAVSFKINCKSSYYISSREVSHYRSQLDYECVTITRNSTQYGDSIGQYEYNGFIVTYETKVEITNGRVKTITWTITSK
jgi:hypothetical protein